MKELLARLLTPATDGGNLSIGRVMLIVCFVLAMWRWAHGVEIMSTQLTILVSLLGYVFGTKVLSGVKGMLGNGKNSEE